MIQKEQELAFSYQRLEVLSRDQERTAERSRILRDMYDGVGSYMSTAISPEHVKLAGLRSLRERTARIGAQLGYLQRTRGHRD